MSPSVSSLMRLQVAARSNPRALCPLLSCGNCQRADSETTEMCGNVSSLIFGSPSVLHNSGVVKCHSENWVTKCSHTPGINQDTLEHLFWPTPVLCHRTKQLNWRCLEEALIPMRKQWHSAHNHPLSTRKQNVLDLFFVLFGVFLQRHASNCKQGLWLQTRIQKTTFAGEL